MYLFSHPALIKGPFLGVRWQHVTNTKDWGRYARIPRDAAGADKNLSESIPIPRTCIYVYTFHPHRVASPDSTSLSIPSHSSSVVCVSLTQKCAPPRMRRLPTRQDETHAH